MLPEFNTGDTEQKSLKDLDLWLSTKKKKKTEKKPNNNKTTTTTKLKCQVFGAKLVSFSQLVLISSLHITAQSDEDIHGPIMPR